MNETSNLNGNNIISSKISDVDKSSQNLSFSVEMTEPRNSKQNCNLILQENEIFDSGIQSESNLTSGFLTGTNVQYLGTDNAKWNISNEEIIEGGVEEFSSNINSETKSSMRLDSGIDIDVSDQFSGSKTDSCNLSEKEENREFRTKYIKVKDVPSPLQPSPDKNWDQLFFKQDENGDTELHLAVIYGDEIVIKHILQIINDSRYLDIQNYYRQTCLHLSVILNQPKITRLLLLAGARTGIEDRNGNTVLHLACKTNYFECVRALLDPLTPYEQKYTTFKYQPKIDLLSDYLNEYNYDGLSCVHMAAMHKDLKILHHLLVNGADVNIRECKAGYTILHQAVISGNFNLVTYILEHSGIDVEIKNYARLTPYQLSAYYPNIGEILLKCGASGLFKVGDESDDDYPTDESDSEDDGYITNLRDDVQIEKVSRMINSLSTGGSIGNRP